MQRYLILLLAIAPAGFLDAQTSSSKAEPPDYARRPKAIAFQNDSQWQDSRWQQTDIGPFLCGAIETPAGLTLKGIAIRVGDQGQGTVCFDTARLRVSAAWTGGFLTFDPRRFGLIRHPRAAGELFFSSPRSAGWAHDGRYEPRPEEITLPEVESGYTAAGASVTRLPKQWAHYRGMHLFGQRVVLDYTVGDTSILESPWLVEADGKTAFIRTLEVSASEEPLQMQVAKQGVQVTLLDSSKPITIEPATNELVIAPRSTTTTFRVLLTKDADAAQIKQLSKAAGPVEPLSQWLGHDPGRFAKVLTTQGETTESNDAYVVDTLTLPFENPWNALLFTAGHDFFSDGRAAICTVHGDVWTVSGIDRDLKELRWRRMATGLSQPLGLKIVDDQVYVLGHSQITRLHDGNGDGEADFYENFNNDAFVTPRTHDYSTCLETGPAGHFYFIHAKTGVMKVSPDGESMVSMADGFRNPNGLGVGPDGTVTAAPQQGQWTPESSLIVVKPGGYYGYGGPRVTDDRPQGWDLPMCFIPREMDNSGGGQVWVQSDRWGPLSGQMLHLSYGQCQILLALRESVGDVEQGGTIKLPTTPADFQSGIMRGRFRPQDGQLYVSGLRGWQTRAIRDGCFQRVRYTGKPVNLPIAVKTYANGIQLTFSQPLDPQVAQDPERFFAMQWNYRWTAAYGSPEFSVANPDQQGRDEVAIRSSTLLADGRTLFLEMPKRQVVHQLAIDYELASATGDLFDGRYVHTINTTPTEHFPESRIVRSEVTPIYTAEQVERMASGAVFQFSSVNGSEKDWRVGRLVALRQPLDQPPTPWIHPGPFRVKVNAAIRVPRSGRYRFRVEAKEGVLLTINGQAVPLVASATDASGDLQSEQVRLRKGYNRMELAYASPQSGVARFRLWWKGADFDWEPVPSRVLSHDIAATQELVAAHQKRQGAALLASHRCDRCHDLATEQQVAPRLSLDSPSLAAAGDRFDADWLVRWIHRPSSLRPETTMPTLLQGDASLQDAADIAAYLQTLRRTDHEATDDEATDDEATDDESAEDADIAEMAADRSLRREHPKAGLAGDALFETLGCLACHHMDSPAADEEFDRISLASAAMKYRDGELVRFLLAPSSFHTDTTMPNFALTVAEARTLADWIREEAQPVDEDPSVDEDSSVNEESSDGSRFIAGDAVRGERKFASAGCRNCHDTGQQAVDSEARQATLIPIGNTQSGCLADAQSAPSSSPQYTLSASEREAIRSYLDDQAMVAIDDVPIEASVAAIKRLQCNRCHDLDGQRSVRPLIVATEGSGQIPEALPSLDWAGEKFRPTWTHDLLAGELNYKSRPWLAARMPAFPGEAHTLSTGLAMQHGIDVDPQPPGSFDPELAKVGQQLTLQNGLDCRQCHGIGEIEPRGDEKTKIALGINFAFIRDRLRHEAYHRFMLDPPRFDVNTKMIKLSEDGLTTKLKSVYDADARRQFEAVWHYIQSLESPTATRSTANDR